MSLFPVKYKKDSVNGGVYDFRQKSAVLWRNALESGYPTTLDNGYNSFSEYGNIAISANLATAQALGLGWLKFDIGAATSTITHSAKDFGVTKLATSVAGTGIGTQIIQAGLIPGGVNAKTTNRMIYECSIDLASSGAPGAATTAPCFLAGLISSVTGLESSLTTASGVRLATRSMMGFQRISSNTVPGDLVFFSQLGGQTAYTQTVLTAAQLAALNVLSTKLNLGFALNSRNSIDIVVNGERYATSLTTPPIFSGATAQIPALLETMLPVFTVLDTITTGTVAALSLEVDWSEAHQTV